MKASLYKLFLKLWALMPFKKQGIYLLKVFNVNFDKYIRDLWFSSPFETSVLGIPFLLVANKDENGMLEIYYKGLQESWDANSIEVWAKLCKKSKTVFDVGANFGLYSIVAKAVNPNSTVYSFEPSQYALKMVQKNIAANKFDIQLFEVALSNTNGFTVFYDSEKSSASSSLVADDSKRMNENYVARKVQTQTFSDFVSQNNISQIDLVSIDVELFEPEVLEGMGNLISIHKPDFIIEVLNNDIGYKIEAYFKDKNYAFYEINEDDMSITRREHLARPSNSSAHSFNFLICTEETASYLKLENSIA